MLRIWIVKLYLFIADIQGDKISCWLWLIRAVRMVPTNHDYWVKYRSYGRLMLKLINRSRSFASEDFKDYLRPLREYEDFNICFKSFESGYVRQSRADCEG